MKDLGKVLQNLVYVGQLGLDLIMPVLLCLGGAWYLDTHLGTGLGIYFVALPLGLAAGGMTFWKFYQRVVMKGYKRKRGKPEKISFSRHI